MQLSKTIQQNPNTSISILQNKDDEEKVKSMLNSLLAGGEDLMTENSDNKDDEDGDGNINSIYRDLTLKNDGQVIMDQEEYE